LSAFDGWVFDRPHNTAPAKKYVSTRVSKAPRTPLIVLVIIYLELF
jgi:hypothetical protein